MKQFSLIILTILLFSSCSNIVTKNEYIERQKGQFHLTGYHSKYLGSDSEYHYLKLGNVVSSKIYRIKLNEVNIESTYPYNQLNPKETGITINP